MYLFYILLNYLAKLNMNIVFISSIFLKKSLFISIHNLIYHFYTICFGNFAYKEQQNLVVVPLE